MVPTRKFDTAGMRYRREAMPAVGQLSALMPGYRRRLTS